jgi:hypothetical protein
LGGGGEAGGAAHTGLLEGGSLGCWEKLGALLVSIWGGRGNGAMLTKGIKKL